MVRRILFTLILCIFPLVFATHVFAVDFKDTSNHWAKGYISELSNRGYLQGYPDGNFLPDKTMTRAEFVSVLLRCMNNSPAYSFTANSSWADAQINEGIRQGIIVISEYPQGYNKDGAINRAEASAMVMRALGKEPNYAFASFKDNNIVNNNPYAGYIKAAQQEGIITGYPDGEFKPYNYITRAQASIILSRFLTNTSYTTPYYDNYSPYTPPSSGIITTPSTTRITTLSVDGYRYNPDYVDIYIDNKPSFYYLSDAEIVNANLLRIGGINYNLSDRNLALKLQGDYYTIDRVYWVNSLATLELSKGRYKSGDYWTNLYLSDIEAVYDSNGNKITRIDSIEFRASGKSTRYDLKEIEIDLYDNYIILDNTKYKPNRVDIGVKRTNYSTTNWWRIEEIRERNDKLIINCEYDRYYDDYYDDYIYHRDIVFIDEDGYEYDSDEIEIRIDNTYRNFERVDVIDRYEFEYGRDVYNLEGSRIRIKTESRTYKITDTSKSGRTLKIYFKEL